MMLNLWGWGYQGGPLLLFKYKLCDQLYRAYTDFLKRHFYKVSIDDTGGGKCKVDVGVDV